MNATLLKMQAEAKDYELQASVAARQSYRRPRTAKQNPWPRRINTIAKELGHGIAPLIVFAGVFSALGAVLQLSA